MNPMIICVISAIIAVLCSASAIILVYSAISSAKSELASDISTVSIELKQTASNCESLRNDLSRLSFENYDHLRQKIETVFLDMTQMSQKVEGLDLSVRNFYSKWARKLGQLKKEEVEAGQTEAVDPTQAQINDLTQPKPATRPSAFRRNIGGR